MANYLTQETLDIILQEDGGFIVLETSPDLYDASLYNIYPFVRVGQGMGRNERAT